MNLLTRAYRSVARGIRRIVEIALLFAVLRLAFGLVLILLFDRGAVAWDYEASAITALAVVVYLAVGLSVRRWAR